MVSTLPLVKQLVPTIVSTPATKWTHLYRLRLELRWACLSLLRGALAAPRQQDIPPECRVARLPRVPTLSARELLRTRDRDRGELWSMECVFKVSSGDIFSVVASKKDTYELRFFNIR